MAFEELRAAARVLKAGGVVGFPTETVYGLGADAMNATAVGRVFELKGRPSRNPLIVHVSGPEMARRVVGAWPEEANRIASALWPGPVTIVVPRGRELPLSVTGGEGSVGVGVRCPDHPVALALLYEFGGPLVGPSANKSGGVSPTTSEHVRDSFRGTGLMVLEGGGCATGIESTVVSLIGAEPRVLRAGVVSAEEIGGIIGRRVVAAGAAMAGSGVGEAEAESALPGPGMLSRHYAPRVPARLMERGELLGLLGGEYAGKSGCVVIARTIIELPPPHGLIRVPMDDSGYAAMMYAALREAESVARSEILIEAPPGAGSSPMWGAIWDRLLRACAAE